MQKIIHELRKGSLISKGDLLCLFSTSCFAKKAILTILVAAAAYALIYLENFVLSHVFNAIDYGEISAILSISVFLAHLLLLGNSTASVRFIPLYLKTKNYKKFHGLIRHYLYYVFSLCTLVFIILFSFSILIWNFTWHPFNFIFNVTWEYLWITPLVALGFFYQMILRSLNAPIASIYSASVLPILLFIFGLEFFKYCFGTISLKSALFMYSCILILIIIGQTLKTVQLADQQGLTFRGIEAKDTWFSTGIQLMFISLFANSEQGIANLLLKLFGHGNASSIGLLNVVYTLTNSMWVAYIACSTLFDDSITPEAQAKNIPKLQALVNKSNLITFSLGLLIFCIFLFFGKTLLGYFGGFYVSGYTVLLIVAGGNLFSLAAGLSLDLAEYALPPKKLMFINIGICFIFVSIGAVLIHFYELYGGAIIIALCQMGMTTAYSSILRKKYSLKAFSIF